MNPKVLHAVRALSDAALIDALFLMAQAHPETFEKVLLAGDGQVFNTPFGTLTFSADDMRQINAYVQGSEKVAAIKLVRAKHGLSLKDAKEFVEADYGLNFGPPNYN